jgi:hypothetical protein
MSEQARSFVEGVRNASHDLFKAPSPRPSYYSGVATRRGSRLTTFLLHGLAAVDAKLLNRERNNKELETVC